MKYLNKQTLQHFINWIRQHLDQDRNDIDFLNSSKVDKTTLKDYQLKPASSFFITDQDAKNTYQEKGSYINEEELDDRIYTAGLKPYSSGSRLDETYIDAGFFINVEHQSGKLETYYIHDYLNKVDQEGTIPNKIFNEQGYYIGYEYGYRYKRVYFRGDSAFRIEFKDYELDSTSEKITEYTTAKVISVGVTVLLPYNYKTDDIEDYFRVAVEEYKPMEADKPFKYIFQRPQDIKPIRDIKLLANGREKYVLTYNLEDAWGEHYGLHEFNFSDSSDSVFSVGLIYTNKENTIPPIYLTKGSTLPNYYTKQEIDTLLDLKVDK